jgi:hypothetical protein
MRRRILPAMTITSAATQSGRVMWAHSATCVPRVGEPMS